jgi:hypothetical protein
MLHAGTLHQAAAELGGAGAARCGIKQPGAEGQLQLVQHLGHAGPDHRELFDAPMQGAVLVHHNEKLRVAKVQSRQHGWKPGQGIHAMTRRGGIQ